MSSRKLILFIVITCLCIIFSLRFDSKFTYKSEVLGIADEELSVSFVGPAQSMAVSTPYGVWVDANGDYYITDSGGFSAAVFKYNSSNTLLKTWGGGGYSYGAQDIVRSPTGFLYILSTFKIRKFDPSDNFILEWGSQGTGPGQFQSGSPPSHIAADSLGNIYVGEGPNGRIQKFDGDGNFILSWIPYDPPDPYNPWVYSLAIDSSDNVWVHCFGDPFGVSQKLMKFTSSGVFIDEAVSEVTGLDMAFDSSGNMYIVSGGSVRKYNAAYTLLDEWSIQGYLGGDSMYDSYSIAIDSSDDIYVTSVIATDYVGIVSKYSSSGELISILTPDSRTGPHFQNFDAIHIGQDGLLYAGTDNLPQVYKYNGSTLVGTYGTGIWGNGDGDLECVAGITTDSQNNAYITDYCDDRVQKFSSTGTYLLQWGGNGSADGQFDNLWGSPTTDSDDNIYIPDCGNNRVQKFDTNGGFLGSFGSFGTGDGEFDCPTGVALDSEGNIIVVDAGNARIQKFTNAGAYSMQWGSIGEGDGQFSAYGLEDIEIDRFDNVYVSDAEYSGSHRRVHLFTTSGEFITMWEDGVLGELGSIPVIPFLAVDQEGALFLAGTGISRIQKFVFDRLPPGIAITPYAADETVDLSPTVFGVATDALSELTEIEFAIDAGGYTSCSAADGTIDEISEAFTCPIQYDLTLGQHTVTVRATDSLEHVNTGNEIVSYTFSVIDFDAPTPTPTATATPTPTATASPTTTVTPTASPTVTPTPTITVTVSATPTVTEETDFGTYTDPTPTVTQTLRVTQKPLVQGEVTGCPVFSKFTISDTIIKRGGKLKLSWTTVGAESVSVSISGETLPLAGSWTFSPSSSGVVTLGAANKACDIKKDFTYSVVDTLPWTTTITAGTSIVAAEVVLAIALQQPTVFGNAWLMIGSAVRKKKTQKWGIAYDSITKKPLGRVVIRLVQNNNTVDTVVSDATGAFRLTPKLGTFTITAQLSGYTFPSALITGDTDGGFTNIYKGQPFSINNISNGILFSIPLDSHAMTEKGMKVAILKKNIAKVVEVTSGLSLAVGFMYSAFIAFQYPHQYNYIVLGLYFLVFLMKALLLFPRKSSGRVHFADGQPAKGVELGLFDSDFNTLLYRTFTNEDGSYLFVVPNKEYAIKVLDTRYRILHGQEKVQELRLKPSNGTETVKIITENFEISG